jgi:hypothetical protein
MSKGRRELNPAWEIFLSEDNNTAENRDLNSCACFQCGKTVSFGKKVYRVIKHLLTKLVGH